MNQLVLGVILLGTALPVAVGLIYGLGLLLALILIQILTQVQDPATMVLQTGGHFIRRGLTNNADDWNENASFTLKSVVNTVC